MADQQIANLIDALQPRAMVPIQQLRQANFNTLFGTVAIGAPNVNGQVRVRYEDDALKNYVQRELGIQAKLQKMDRMRLAMLNPNQYMIDKERDLIRISDDCADRFKLVYTQALQRGMSNEDTEKAARKAAEELYKSELVTHRANFPKEVTQSLYKKLM